MIRALAFDFDGVLVETAEVKTQAFARLFRAEPPATLQAIVQYHERNGGISRFEKFKTIYRDILKRPLDTETFQQLCDDFAQLVVKEVLAAPWVEGAHEFLVRSRRRYQLFVVSGTPEAELTDILRRRDMADFFEAILGSPRTKDVLLHAIMATYALKPTELVFVGDAPTDWMAARQTGVHFIWRRHAGGTALPREWSGPLINSCSELEACLAVLEGAEALQ